MSFYGAKYEKYLNNFRNLRPYLLFDQPEIRLSILIDYM